MLGQFRIELTIFFLPLCSLEGRTGDISAGGERRKKSDRRKRPPGPFSNSKNENRPTSGNPSGNGCASDYASPGRPNPNANDCANDCASRPRIPSAHDCANARGPTIELFERKRRRFRPLPKLPAERPETPARPQTSQQMLEMQQVRISFFYPCLYAPPSAHLVYYIRG